MANRSRSSACSGAGPWLLPAGAMPIAACNASSGGRTRWIRRRGVNCALHCRANPLLVGASRKRFLRAAEPDDPAHRDAATAATSLLSAQAGARCVRVHDVASTVSALRVVAAVAAAS